MVRRICLESLSAYWFVRPGDVVFDIGAYRGTNSALYLKRGASAVYAFEPLPMNRDHIPETVKSHPAFHLMPYALSDQAGRHPMLVPRRNKGASTLSRPFFEWSNRGDEDLGAVHEASVHRIDDLDLPRANFWKIDVEGSELAVLRGAEQTIRRNPPDIIQLEIFAREKTLYSQTLAFLADRFAHVWALGVTVEGDPIHYAITPEVVKSRRFHEDLRRGATPHYYASFRGCRAWAQLAESEAQPPDTAAVEATAPAGARPENFGSS